MDRLYPAIAKLVVLLLQFIGRSVVQLKSCDLEASHHVVFAVQYKFDC